MPGGMEQRDAAQDGGARAAGEDLHHLLGARAERAVVGRFLQRRRRELAAPVAVLVVALDLARASPDCLSLLAQGHEVDLAGELRHLWTGHAETQVTARDD